MKNISGLVRQIEDVKAHSMGRPVYIDFTHPDHPGYVRTYISYGGDFMWEYSDGEDHYTIRQLLMSTIVRDLEFSECGTVSHTGQGLTTC